MNSQWIVIYPQYMKVLYPPIAMGRPQPLLNFYLPVHLHLAISGKFLCWRYFTEIVKTFLANEPCWYGVVPALAQMQDVSIL
jgi:hypothetical protein